MSANSPRTSTWLDRVATLLSGGGSGRFGPGTVSRDAVLSFVYNGIVRVGTAALSVVVARRLGPTGNGELGVALQVVAFAVLVTSFNIPQGLAQHLAGTADPRKRALWVTTSARMVLGLSAFGGAVVAVLAAPAARIVFADPQLTPALRACAPLVLTMAGYLLTESALQGLRRFASLGRWGTTVTILDLVFVVPAARYGVSGVLIARSLVRLFAVAASWLLWLRKVAWPPSESRPVATMPESSGASSLLAFAGPTFLGAAATLAGQLSLRTLLVRHSGLDQTGQLQAADSLAQGLLLIPIATTAALMPAISRMRESTQAAFASVFTRGLRQVTGLHLGVCLAAMAIVPVLVPLIFGREFTAARPVFVGLAAAYGLAGPSTVFAATLLGRGEVWSGTGLNLLWSAAVLLSFGASSRYGALGASLAMAFGYLVMLVVCAIAFPRRWSVPFRAVATPIVCTPFFLAAGAGVLLGSRVPQAAGAGLCLLLGTLSVGLWTLRPPKPTELDGG